ncbi:noncanonical pyrimidine nucleotidase, YjjG family [Bacillus sp. SD075]|uniref:YjjG family noncanonical pyrimidine nucleotidase n=1 Tax=Bacillus sp. SD075 TaxID=2781732 RepID=UPI001A97616B|nr:YjjG family noncanonical pyrimidine nucleotidase [Bacillus sp. SD075]MBO0996733.1 noncanonical pyrimidine nucleotidase, YjjG family [Bacillus sp. SD075]
MKYEIILFDADDTLLDFGVSEKKALHEAFLEFGVPRGAEDYTGCYQEISEVLWRDLEQGLIDLTNLGVERFRRLFLKHGLDINADAFSRTYLEHLGKEIHLVPGAFEVCEKLGGCRLAIITNGFTTVQKARIGGSPLCNTFETLIVSQEVGVQKPDRGIFDYAFSKLKITDKSKALIVGDSLTSDIQGGLNYGMDTCWYNPHQKDNNLGIKPTYEIRTLADLLEIVGSKEV